MKTKDKIIKAALELFNQHGERNITTNHIATHLGISPGNLYYHFRNKEDIIHCIFDEYKRVFQENFQFEQDAKQLSALETLQKYLNIVFELMWKFNFFYTSLPDILTRDKDLQQKYLAVQKLVHEDVSGLIKWLNSEKIIQVPEEDIDNLTHNIKLVTVFWVSYFRSQQQQQSVNKADLYQGVLKIFALFKPYFVDNKKTDYQALEAYYQQLASQSASISGE